MKYKIVVLAGRRIDDNNAKRHRFPQDNSGLVKDRIMSFFQNNPTKLLVCSAACGADLLALEVAGTLGIKRKVILPFDKETFKRISVIDRPGNWGDIYNNIINSLNNEDLIELFFSEDDPKAFSKTNKEILNLGEKYKNDETELIAVIVWDGLAKDKDDATSQFAKAAKSRNVSVKEIATI